MYESSADGLQNLFLASHDGHVAPVRLTDFDEHYQTVEALWGGDGATIVLVTRSVMREAFWAIKLSERRHPQVIRLHHEPASFTLDFVSSPDGRKVVCSTLLGNLIQTYVLDPDGKEPSLRLCDPPKDALQDQLNSLVASGADAAAKNDFARLREIKDELHALRDPLGTIKCVNRACGAAAKGIPSKAPRRQLGAVLGALVGTIASNHGLHNAGRDIGQVMEQSGVLGLWYESLRVRLAEQRLDREIEALRQGQGAKSGQ
jgi:hypothetical protein